MDAPGSTTALPDRPVYPAAGRRTSLVADDTAPHAPISGFPAGWLRLFAVELVVFVAIGATYAVVPGPAVSALCAGSICIGMLTSRIARFEGTEIADILRRFTVLVAGVVLPLALFGASLALWSVGEDGVAWTGAVAAISLVVLAASIIAGKRTAILLAVQVGVWTGFACVASGWTGVVALLLSLPVVGAVFMRQVGIERRDSDAAAAAGRVQTRAEEILTDYEETGQGWFWETDRRGMLTYLSRPVAAIVGCAVDELIGRPLGELFDQAPQSSDGERTLSFALSVRSSFNELGMRAASADGEQRWWSVSGRPIYDGFKNWTLLKQGLNIYFSPFYIFLVEMID